MCKKSKLRLGSYTLKFDFNGHGYTIVKIKGEGADLIIPKEFNDGKHGARNVTAILHETNGKYRYHNCIHYTGDIASWCGITGLDKIVSSSRTLYIDGNKVDGDFVIPEGVTSIGDYAFYNCKGLTSITIPDSVTSIDSYAFCGCTGLTSITIPDSVTSIGCAAFKGCKGLTEITLPFVGQKTIESKRIIGSKSNGINQVFGWIFGYTTTNSCLTTISNATYQYDEHVFLSHKDSKYYHYYIPTSLKSVIIKSGDIPNNAFINCEMLRHITVPSDTMSIGESAFFGCKRLESITIPDSVTSIGESAFLGCHGLRSITIPNSVTSIGSSAFGGCVGLRSVTIPNSVTSIGKSAFEFCKGMTNITIPNSVTKIGWAAFEKCLALTMYCEAEFEPADWAYDWNPDNRPVVWGAEMPYDTICK